MQSKYAKLHDLVNAPQLGQVVPGFGEIVGVWCGGSERYYFLLDDRSCVAFMPASAIEPKPPKTA